MSSASIVSQTLTNYARGVAQDRRSALAEFIAPTVRVASATGKYKEFNDKNAFQVYETSRAIGGNATRIEFAATDRDYSTAPQALELPIDDHERQQSGESDPLGLERAKIDTLVSAAVTSHENKVLAAAKAGLSAVVGAGVWSDSGVDPIKEIDEQIEAIATATGMMPTRIAFGLGAWRVFRGHPKVIARQPGAAIIGVTEQQASSLLLNPAIEVKVGVLSKDNAKFGAAKSAINIVGAEVWIFLGTPNPTQFDPSFMKTFTSGAGSVDSVRTYREERSRSDILAVDWSEDIKVVSTISARRITLS